MLKTSDVLLDLSSYKTRVYDRSFVSEATYLTTYNSFK